MAQKLFIPITLLMSNVQCLNPKSRIFVFQNEGKTNFNPVFLNEGINTKFKSVIKPKI